VSGICVTLNKKCVRRKSEEVSARQQTSRQTPGSHTQLSLGHSVVHPHPSRPAVDYSCPLEYFSSSSFFRGSQGFPANDFRNHKCGWFVQGSLKCLCQLKERASVGAKASGWLCSGRKSHFWDGKGSLRASEKALGDKNNNSKWN
jgi:hypothetical protein